MSRTLGRKRGPTEEAAIAAINQARRRLRLTTIGALGDEATAAAQKEQLSSHGFPTELPFLTSAALPVGRIWHH
ncbi:hypothetical protein IWX81_002123 [Salinibacterium sp. CAN_S4]